MYWIGLPGALCAWLFPDWLHIPLGNFQSIHSFGIHGAMTIFAVLLLAGGESRVYRIACLIGGVYLDPDVSSVGYKLSHAKSRGLTLL